ncbi:MAG: glycoside hydrolase family 36 protein [Acidimicrobiia bacterium]
MLDHLDRPHLRIRTFAGSQETPITGPGPHQLGPFEVTVRTTGPALEWSVANTGRAAESVISVAVVGHVGRFTGPVPIYCEGYQSWSQVRVAHLGLDDDPSRAGDTFALFRGGLHADPEVTAEHELRSEQVVVVSAADGTSFAFGFGGGTLHDGTFRIGVAHNHIEIQAEAYLGGAQLAPGEARALHPVRAFRDDDPEAMLGTWARWAGELGGARTTAPPVTGWCSWYHYFDRVTEASVRTNLARIGDWPLEVFQVDDGYQAAIGDWTRTNARFPSDLGGLAADILAAGRRPGLWWAPFLVAPDSEVARNHPEWLAHLSADEPLIGMINDAWGGVVWTLDPTVPEVLEHLRTTAAALRAAGFEYQKLDFTYAPALPGIFADPHQTPAQRVRAAFDAVRAGAGDDAFLLGCGAPLAATVGVVDAMRIGPDVAPNWHRFDVPGDLSMPGYEWTNAATLHAWNSALLRAYQHRRLWANDPDCIMLRTDDTELGFDAARAWALAAGVSGGSIVVSDDLALLDANARALLDDVIELAAASDAAAVSGRTPQCTDRFEHAVPTTITGGGHTLHIDDVDDPIAALD